MEEAREHVHTCPNKTTNMLGYDGGVLPRITVALSIPGLWFGFYHIYHAKKKSHRITLMADVLSEEKVYSRTDVGLLGPG